MARQSQNAGILQALKEGAHITPMGALRRFGCFRLSARIADLRKMGVHAGSEGCTRGIRHISRIGRGHAPR